MKLLIASDLHGSYEALKALIERFEAEKCERILLLGDLLYHGPRNGLHPAYDPIKTIDLIKEYADKIFAVKGNCDSEVDEMVTGLNLPVFTTLYNNEHLIFATHGHHYSPQTPPKLYRGDVLLTGHTHVVACEVYDNFTYINPGSLCFPKTDNGPTYIVFDDGKFIFKKLDGTVLMEHSLA